MITPTRSFLRFAVLLIFYLSLDSAYGRTYVATFLSIDPALGFSQSDAGAASDGRFVGTAVNYGLIEGNYFHNHAVLWNGAGETAIDLNPAGVRTSIAHDISGNIQVGRGAEGIYGDFTRPLMWRGSAESVVDLTPAGFDGGVAYTTSDAYQGGFVYADGQFHAALWNGSATSFVDLHPSGFAKSMVHGVSGLSQVGVGYANEPSQDGHALLWNGAAASVIDLNPGGFTQSIALNSSENRQVGYGRGPVTGNEHHALLWSGTAASAIDLHPAGFRYSQARGILGDTQVGMGVRANDEFWTRALLWNSSSESVVDLHQYAASLGESIVGSVAYDVDMNGRIVGWVVDSNYESRAVVWTPIPEPPASTVAFVVAIVAGNLGRRLRYRD